jgi:L-aminopeptidase/D-esterase-like protein
MAERAEFSVGHWTDTDAMTGCTVILFDRLVSAVADVRGGAPGTRETDLLGPDRLVGRADAFLLAGGSAHGLAAAEGVMKYLRERGRGFHTAAGPVPIVPAAVLFDLSVGKPVWPDAEAGYAACASAGPVESSALGQIGAGTGATIRKAWRGLAPKPGGFGWSTLTFSPGLTVTAMAAVNAVGEVIQEAGRADQREPLLTNAGDVEPGTATNLVAVVIDGECDARTLRRAAISAHDAMARVIVPCHTIWDGDVVFVAATGDAAELAIDRLMPICVATELVVERAIRSAVPP